MVKIIIGLLIMFSYSITNANTFYYWHCTWYIANEKDINWRGNAKDWYINASNAWNRVWYNAVKNSIVVFNWIGYNSLYWHVAIVKDIIWEYIIIREMNYKGLWLITHRIIKRSDSNIVWYIYK